MLWRSVLRRVVCCGVVVCVVASWCVFCSLVCWFVRFCLFVCLFCLSVRLSVCQSVCLSAVCLSVCVCAVGSIRRVLIRNVMGDFGCAANVRWMIQIPRLYQGGCNLAFFLLGNYKNC